MASCTPDKLGKCSATELHCQLAQHRALEDTCSCSWGEMGWEEQICFLSRMTVTVFGNESGSLVTVLHLNNGGENK